MKLKIISALLTVTTYIFMKTLKTRISIFSSVIAIAGLLASRADAEFIVNDIWADGDRTSTGPDGGGIDSAWFNGGGGTMTATVGNLNKTVGAASSSWTTYLTPAASPVSLTAVGDAIRVTWVFKPTGVNVGQTSQQFNLAIANSSLATRISVDGSPGSGIYPGYAMWMNMATILGNANPFQLRERNIAAGSTGFLSASGSWTALDDEETSGVTGYADGVQYTFVFTATLNASLGLDIAASMTGGSIGGDGSLNVSFTDTTPNTNSFDTFGVRPSSAAGAASQIDTSLFSVEFLPVPEPSSLVLAGLGLLGVICARRSLRR